MGNVSATALFVHVDGSIDHCTPTVRAGKSMRGYVQLQTGGHPIRHGKLVLSAHRSLPLDQFHLEEDLWTGEWPLQPHSVYKFSFSIELPDWLPNSVGRRQQVSDLT